MEEVHRSQLLEEEALHHNKVQREIEASDGRIGDLQREVTSAPTLAVSILLGQAQTNARSTVLDARSAQAARSFHWRGTKMDPLVW